MSAFIPPIDAPLASFIAAPLRPRSGYVCGRFFSEIHPLHEQLTRHDIPACRIYQVAVYRVGYILPINRWELWHVAADNSTHAEEVARYHLCYSSQFEVLGEAKRPVCLEIPKTDKNDADFSGRGMPETRIRRML